MDEEQGDFDFTEINISFIERMLKSLPSNIYFKDAEGRYVFCTHYWHHLDHDDDPDWTIRGKLDIDIRKDRANAMLAREEDLRILETRVGASYEIKEEADGVTEYYQLTKNPVLDDDGNVIGIVGLIHDITKMKELEQKLERLAVIDQLTGLKNRQFIDIWLENHVEDDVFPLSLVVADCDDLKTINDAHGHLAGDECIVAVARILEARLPEEGQAIRFGGDEFLLILPKTSYDQAQSMIEAVAADMEEVTVEGKPVSVSMGASTRLNGPIKLGDCLRLADMQMYARKNDRKTGNR